MRLSEYLKTSHYSFRMSLLDNTSNFKFTSFEILFIYILAFSPTTQGK